MFIKTLTFNIKVLSLIYKTINKYICVCVLYLILKLLFTNYFDLCIFRYCQMKP